ncbi:acid-sensing ion channel 5-like [Branchiostoma floridae]|nr:acid-sensing ion channel 5-like [Branchiostoma floridae]
MDKPGCSSQPDYVEDLPDYETATGFKPYPKEPAASSQDDKKEEEPKSPEYEFASGTTMHGLGKIADAPNLPARLMWTVFFLVAFGYAAYLITQTFISYFNWETITDVKLEFSESLEFPAVTLCNFNKYEKRSEVSQNFDAIDYLSPIIGNAFLPSTGGDIPQASTNDSLYSLSLMSITDFAGFRLDADSLMDCTWKGERCYAENFTKVYTTFGNCYIFNAASDQNLVQTIPGAGNGLHIVVDVKKDMYTEDLEAGGNSDVGLKLHVHPKYEPPELQTQGIAVGPGNHAYVGISQVTYVNEIHPWGICEHVQLDHYDTYTFSACMLECKAHHVQDECGCTALELIGSVQLESDPQICSPQQIADCVNSVYQRVQTGQLPCYCPTPCEIVEYDTTVSYAGWPNPKASEKLTRDYPDLSQDYLKENWVVFDVYYKQLNFQKIEQKRKTSVEGLLSILGGCLGLCIGASVVSITEFAYYLLLRPAKFIMKRTKKNLSTSRTNIVQVRSSPVEAL